MPRWTPTAFKSARGQKLLHIIHLTRKSHKDELPKVIVTESIWKAMQRCWVHLLPVCTSVAILTINFHGIYIGIDISGPVKSDTINLMFLQMAAKLHEVLIVGSLGLILLQAARHELLYGDGLPLGLIGSSLVFNNFDFFFKKEFYGALSCLAHNGRLPRKLAFLALLIVSGVIALLVGPASATLLVAKSQTFPAGGTQFFLNGSPDRFWPSDLSGDMSELQQFCSNGASAEVAICPAGGYLSLWDRWNTLNYTNFIENTIPAYAKPLAGSTFYWPVHSPVSQIPALYALGNARVDGEEPQLTTFLVQAHAASAVMLQRITTDWWEALSSQAGFNPLRIDDRNVKSSVPSSFSAVRCSEPQNLSATHQIVQFPTVKGRWEYSENAAFKVESLKATSSNHLRFQWAHLPGSFGPLSIGGVIEAPWSADNASRVVVGCSVQTGWVPTNIFTDSYTFWSGWYPWGISYGDRTPSWHAVPEGKSDSPTNGRIALGDEWLNMLTPRAPATNLKDSTWQPSTIESILTAAGLATTPNRLTGTTMTEDWRASDLLPSAGKTRLLEAIIASVLVDGLSRSGSHLIFNNTASPGTPPSSWPLAMYNPLPTFPSVILTGKLAFQTPSPTTPHTTLTARMQITGFAYKATLASFLSTAVLLAHIAMVIVHIAVVLCRGKRKHTSSKSWTSISELVALAQNSRPAPRALRNTGGGIKCAKTFARVGRIRVRERPSEGGAEQVELMFQEDHTDSVSDMSSVATSREDLITASELDLVRRARGSYTFPLAHDQQYCGPALEPLGSQSSIARSREELISTPDFAEEQRMDVVRIGHAYR